MNKFSLEKQPKIKSGFTVPMHYFEQFPEIVLEKTIMQAPKKANLITLKNFSYTAAAVLIIGLSILFLMPKSATDLEQIDTAALENYISYQSVGSQYEVLNLIDPKDIDAMQVDLNLEDEAVENVLINNPNFENYIAE